MTKDSKDPDEKFYNNIRNISIVLFIGGNLLTVVFGTIGVFVIFAGILGFIIWFFAPWLLDWNDDKPEINDLEVEIDNLKKRLDKYEM